HARPPWAAATPVLSVLMPFLRDDPSVRLRMLDREAHAVAERAELIILDDGTADPALTARLTALIDALSLPARLITLGSNEGRSIRRNRLAEAARGRILQCMDSDMCPDHVRLLIALDVHAINDDLA